MPGGSSRIAVAGDDDGARINRKKKKNNTRKKTIAATMNSPQRFGTVVLSRTRRETGEAEPLLEPGFAEKFYKREGEERVIRVKGRIKRGAQREREGESDRDG